MDLVREILLEIESQPFTGEGLDLSIEGYTPEEITYHVMILCEAGLIDSEVLSTFSGTDWRPTRLTWDGHEFLAAARDESRWKTATSTVLEKAGGLAFEVLRQLLMKLMMEQVLPSL
jgi:YD repeat-containing protein